MSKGNKRLIGLLAGLLVLIVGLVVSIVTVNILNGNGDDGLSNCSKRGSWDEQYDCLIDVYESDGAEASKTVFDSILDKMLDSGDYEGAVDLLSNWGDALFFENKCEMLIRIVNENKAQKLPPDELEEYYQLAYENVSDCGDDKLANELMNKRIELESSGLLSPPDMDVLEEGEEMDEYMEGDEYEEDGEEVEVMNE